MSPDKKITALTSLVTDPTTREDLLHVVDDP